MGLLDLAERAPNENALQRLLVRLQGHAPQLFADAARELFNLAERVANEDAQQHQQVDEAHWEEGQQQELEPQQEQEPQQHWEQQEDKGGEDKSGAEDHGPDKNNMRPYTNLEMPAACAPRGVGCYLTRKLRKLRRLGKLQRFSKNSVRGA